MTVWRILNPAPEGLAGRHWGDTAFAESLAHWLRIQGQDAHVHGFESWGKQTQADVTLHLRGKWPCPHRIGGLKILWIISHPSRVSLSECARYDLILCASSQHAEQLARKLDRPVATMVQCVDPRQWQDRSMLPESTRRGFLFVGNARGTLREVVCWATQEGLPLQIWGTGWEHWYPMKTICGTSIDNLALGDLYCRARATLNDHARDMCAFGYANNRLFDALACGLPVVSDANPAIAELFNDTVMQFANQREFKTCLERLWLEYPLVHDQVQAIVPHIRKNHTFEQRALELVRLAHHLQPNLASTT